ncbi:MAG TPA: tetratricopeptide repeat protein [Symbiobacteriaceae bacterium]|nr:tetratricopeptide repeat protein [Symbiobacteriaceae bacterium]
MAGGSLTFYLACVTVDHASETDLRSRLQGPLSVSPLRAVGDPLDQMAPLHVYTSDDISGALAAGLELAERPAREGGLAVALHVASDGAVLTEANAREALRLALAAKSPCFLVSAAAVGRLGGALPKGYELVALGPYRRKDLAPAEALHLLRRSDTAVVPEFHLLDEGRNRLPIVHTPFVGRAKEMAALSAALMGHRLVTVTGPCGAGKSRLAAQAAAAISDEFDDGICYLDLSRVSVSSLAGALQGRRLLVLDNVEHLTGSLPETIRTLLDTNSNLRILCTSVSPLGLQSEYRFPLSPLSLTPEAGASLSEAAQLFLTRTTAASDALSIGGLDLVNELCQALGGVPLAIEYASELVEVVPLTELTKRLRTDLSLLTTQKADLPDRHRSMRSSLAQNCTLLSAEARVLFRRVSFFREQFTLAAAEAVCPDISLTTDQILPLLRELSNSSLVMVEQQQGAPVYSLLPVTRVFGRSCLDAAGETEALRSRHRDWFLELIEPISRSKDRARWTRVDLVYPDIEAALQWALATGDGTAAQRFCVALSGYWSTRGRLLAGYQLLTQALQLPSESPFHHTKALTAAGCMAGDLGELASGEALLRQAIARWRELDDVVELARTLMNLGVALRRQGRYDEAESAYRESLAYQSTLPDQSDLVLTYLNLGVVLGTRGDHAQAVVQFHAALDTARRIGDQWGAATALSQLAVAAVTDKRLDDAAACRTEALVLFRDMGDQLGVLVTLSSLAGVSRELGNLEQAQAYYRECLTIALKMRRMTTVLDTLDQLMQILLGLKQLEVVARLLGFCDLARQRESVPRSPELTALVLTLTEKSTKALGGTWFGALYRAGSIMSLEQAVEVATSVTTPIIPQVPLQDQSGSDLPAPEGAEGLSAREVQIIHLLVQGLSSRELGERLFLSPRTVEKHLERLRQRLGVPNKARLIAWALQNGFGQRTEW